MGVDSDERRYLDACEAGLSVLQQIDCIIVRLTNAGNALVNAQSLPPQTGVDQCTGARSAETFAVLPEQLQDSERSNAHPLLVELCLQIRLFSNVWHVA